MGAKYHVIPHRVVRVNCNFRACVVVTVSTAVPEEVDAVLGNVSKTGSKATVL